MVTWRRQGRDAEFIENVQNMYEQGELNESSARPGESDAGGIETDAERPQRYDPKARAFVGEHSEHDTHILYCCT